MSMPVQLKMIGSGICSTIWYPDIMQNPFNIGLGAAVVSGATASVTIEHTFDYTTVMNPTFDGVRAWSKGAGAGAASTVIATATWFANSAFSTSGGVAVGSTEGTFVQGNYAFGVAAIRLNVVNSNAGTDVTVVNLIQSVNAP